VATAGSPARAQHPGRQTVEGHQRPADAAKPPASGVGRWKVPRWLVGGVVERHLAVVVPITMCRVGPRVRSKPDQKYAAPSDTNARPHALTTDYFTSPAAALC
jgi:hypothetical protein